jgi:hypothetical protein
MSDRGGESEPAGAGMDGGPTMIDVTPTPVPEPEPHPGRPVKDRVAAAALSALVVLVLALATSPYWAPPVASVLPWGGAPEAMTAPADTTAVEPKLSALERRLARLEQHPPETQQSQALSALGDRLAAIDQRIATVAATASSQTAADATKGLQAEVQVLTQKLDQQSQLLARLQSQEAAGADRTDAALVVTVGQLRAVLATARSYAAELQAAEALAKDRPDTLAELHKLDSRAQQGVPTLAMLTERFAAAKAASQASAPAPAAEQGWRARVLATLKSLVTIRRAGAPQGKGAEGGDALVEAQLALKNGDLAAAVAAVRRAEGSASPTMTSWLEDAQAWLDAEAALAAADASLMKRFLAEPGAGAKP